MRKPRIDALPSIPVSWGELLDRISILEIKVERMTDFEKLQNVQRERELLEAIRTKNQDKLDSIASEYNNLKKTNQALWDLENDIREKERRSSFGSAFVQTARAIHKKNDERARLKRKINETLGSPLTEEKQY